MQRKLLWAGVVVSWALGVVIPARARAQDLPSEAAKRIKEFDAAAEAIRKKANEDIIALQDKLIADLEQLQTKHTKAGELEAALAIRERIRPLKESREKARNLLVNGSFEKGPEINPGDGYMTLEKDSTAIEGWVVSHGNIDIVASDLKAAYDWKAADGKRSVDLNGTMAGAISQTFKTTKGQKYRVRFALAGNPIAGPAEKKLQVSAAGTTKEFTFDATGKTRTDMGWVTRAWEFTAEADETTLEFRSLIIEGGSGPALDDVVVVAIRE